MTTRVVAIGDPSGIAEARRVAVAAAQSLGFDEEITGRAALVATELATNLWKHGREGELLLNCIDDDEGLGVECIAVDRGNGIRNHEEAMRDGFSTAGSPGTGLGAIRRASHAFDLYSHGGNGTAVLSRIRLGRPASKATSPLSSAIEIPQSGETVSGDGSATSRRAMTSRAVVADGLGHGEGAAIASRAAIKVFLQDDWAAPRDALARMHAALAPTRGAAIAIAVADSERQCVRFAGIGNVMAAIVTTGGTKQMVSLHGTVGHVSKRVQEFEYPFVQPAFLVMCSDGMLTNWSLSGYPGLLQRDPALIAGVLYRDFKRGRDDLTALVVRI